MWRLDPRQATMIVATLALLLAAVPWIWVYRQRGPHRDRSAEGRIDGLLLLATLLLTLFATAMSVVALVRAVRERQEHRASRPVAVRIEACHVSEGRPAGRTGGRSYGLTCDVTHVSHGAPVRGTLHAGFPPRRSGYDAWRDAHPPGTTVTLRQMTGAPFRLVGFEQVVPSTRTAAHAGGRALGFSLAALLAFLASRLLVRWRRP